MRPIYLTIAALLLLCLAPMPYGYFQFVRVVAMIAFAVLSYMFYTEDKIPLAITCGGLALLFQPFLKVVLGRTMWNIVDVIVAIVLIALTIKQIKQHKS